MTEERFEVQRMIAAEPAAIFSVLCDPEGHVAIDPPLRHIYGYRLEAVDGGTLTTSYYDWSEIDPVWREAGIFPVMPEAALRATLGILARTVTRAAAL